MIVQVDPTSAVPVFEQLRAQIERLILSGGLRPGSQLPPIRTLASDLDLARGTVSRVYDELARAGLVATAGRHGTTVLAVRGRLADPNARASAAEALALVALQLGVDVEDARDALDGAGARGHRAGHTAAS